MGFQLCFSSLFKDVISSYEKNEVSEQYSGSFKKCFLINAWHMDILRCCI